MRLDDDVSVGPGTLAMFATCLFIVRRVANTSTKMPKITQAQGKQLPKFVYMFLLEQVLDDTLIGRSLVSALACTLNHYGLEAVAENFLWFMMCRFTFVWHTCFGLLTPKLSNKLFA